MAEETNPKIHIKITFNDQSMTVHDIKLQSDKSDPKMTFNTRREKPLVKVFNAFSKRLAMDENSLRFYFNEKRIRPEQSPAELEMEDGEEIDATVEQEGGTYPGAIGNIAFIHSFTHGYTQIILKLSEFYEDKQ